MKKITADYHLHSDVSPDCKTPMEESCEAAIQKGLTELVFTEHMELFSANFKRYPICSNTLTIWPAAGKNLPAS